VSQRHDYVVKEFGRYVASQSAADRTIREDEASSGDRHPASAGLRILVDLTEA
jgi:hypothetical protein